MEGPGRGWIPGDMSKLSKLRKGLSSRGFDVPHTRYAGNCSNHALMRMPRRCPRSVLYRTNFRVSFEDDTVYRRGLNSTIPYPKDKSPKKSQVRSVHSSKQQVVFAQRLMAGIQTLLCSNLRKLAASSPKKPVPTEVPPV